jgi:hypothetical protein
MKLCDVSKVRKAFVQYVYKLWCFFGVLHYIVKVESYVLAERTAGVFKVDAEVTGRLVTCILSVY